MKKLIIIGTIICACIIEAEEGHADVRCYTNPYNYYVTCEDKGHVKPWTDNQRQSNPPSNNPYLQPPEIEMRKEAPKIIDRECTVGTGCPQWRYRW